MKRARGKIARKAAADAASVAAAVAAVVDMLEVVAADAIAGIAATVANVVSVTNRSFLEKDSASGRARNDQTALVKRPFSTSACLVSRRIASTFPAV